MATTQIQQKPKRLATHSNDEFLTIIKAGRLMPGGKVAPATVWRWTTKGIQARSGERIILQSFRFGRRLRVRASDITDFASRLAAANAAGFEPVAAA